DRRLARVQIRLAIEGRAGAFEDSGRFDERLLPLFADEIRHLRIVRRRDANGRGAPTPTLAALVEQDAVGLQIVDAAEVGSVAEWPVHRRRRQTERPLDLIEERERIQ